jgi:hypothetical protein
MSDLTVVNDDGVQRVSASLATIHDNFHSAFQTLKTTLAQHDGAWGNDNMGSHFASGYVPGANQAKENCQTILDNVGTLSGDLVTVVERFHSTDCENANNTSKAGSSQGPWQQTYMPGSVTGPGPVVP